MSQTKRRARAAGFCLTILVLSGCGNLTARLSEVGSEPPLSAIQNPVAQPGYQPVSLPLPATVPAQRNPNSLWRTGARGFFRDQRASQVGDILTVLIDLNDSAKINNTTSRSRVAAEDASLGRFLGYEAALNAILPEAISNTALVDADSKGSHTGAGKIERDETIKLKVAAIITQILPNGNMVIQGRQEIRVNFEVRELQVAGVIRPEDIGSTNTIKSEKIAEARIAYGGRGQLNDMQQPRYGQQIYDIIFPF